MGLSLTFFEGKLNKISLFLRPILGTWVSLNVAIQSCYRSSNKLLQLCRPQHESIWKSISWRRWYKWLHVLNFIVKGIYRTTWLFRPLVNRWQRWKFNLLLHSFVRVKNLSTSIPLVIFFSFLIFVKRSLWRKYVF